MLKELMKARGYTPITRLSSGEELNKDNLALWRGEILSKLEKYIYGVTPKMPVSVYLKSVELVDELAYAGKAKEEHLTIAFTTERGEFSFPISVFTPNKAKTPPPVLLHIAFRPVPDRYIPVEEIIDGGFALVVVVYTDLLNDIHFGDFSDGLGKYFDVKAETRGPDTWGKIGMWAYGVSRVMDYIETRDDLDKKRVSVIGHSRLGKTALWCVAQDERFYAAVSNNSGYGGARSSKFSTGEGIKDFLRVGSWAWFTESFKDYLDCENEKPYDQAELLGLIAPRYLLVNSAEEDTGADPTGELLTTLNASGAWERLGARGLACQGEMPDIPSKLFDGNVGYFIRGGRHFLSREDWGATMEFLNKKFDEHKN